eukprot:TRINITY_DN1012_c0_g3_i1.p1 TRINITY_DN1012_c0_g3~~TRINITY_DN1012_c0_g3_i1.p1  ORF type:complete len:494 (-),score=99.74 TRINITY_DN1012_c0_g3_i1:95-1576(-)
MAAAVAAAVAEPATASEASNPKKKLAREGTIRFKHNFVRFNPNTIDHCYQMDKTALGEGSFGKVSKGKDKVTGAVRAIKAIDKSRISNPARFDQEVAIQQQMDHINIVKLYEVFKDAKKWYLVMEICTGGELFDRIVAETEKHEGSAFDESQAATYMRQILGAMQYIHAHNFVHRDIKPENFLLQNETKEAQIKVIDFGLAKKYDNSSDPPMKTKAGTPYYVAPQVLSSQGYDEKCDIWSCGVILYILLCGYPPFYGDNDSQILRCVKRGVYDFPSPEWDDISSDAKSMIKLMLMYDSKMRPSADVCLQHHWIQQKSAKSTGKVSRDLGGKLKAFRGSSKLKKVALTAIAQQLKDEDIVELQKTFQLLDKNGDGTLTPAEITDGMKSHGVAFPPELEGILRQLDTDGSGSIDYTEFIAATISRKAYLKKDAMWAAFRTFDRDGDASISRDELVELLKDPSMAVIESMIHDVDSNGDGKIQFDEFCRMLEAQSD